MLITSVCGLFFHQTSQVVTTTRIYPTFGLPVIQHNIVIKQLTGHPEIIMEKTYNGT
jgi:hypothetical protein